jgi:hypothetical protein
MALADLQVFNEYAYSSFTELLDYNIDLFNQATRGGIILQGTSHQGDYSDTAMWAKIANLVRRRNAYGAGAVAEKVLQQLLDTSVKVAAGTAPVRIDPSMMRWILKSPEEAGAVVGVQMAQQALADMLDAALRCFRAAHEAQATNYYDASAGNASLGALNLGRAKLGDRASDLACWVLHSKQMFDIFGTALTNANMLFSFGTVKVTHDGFGNPFVVSDSAQLTVAGPTYRALGFLTAGVVIGRNDDFQDNISTTNGDENIKRTYQAEWSFNVGVKGFQWDKTNGGHSPTDAALGTATNWDMYATSYKDLGGVVVKTL